MLPKKMTMGQELNIEILRDFLLEMVESLSNLTQPNKTTYLAHHLELREQWVQSEMLMNSFLKVHALIADVPAQYPRLGLSVH